MMTAGRHTAIDTHNDVWHMVCFAHGGKASGRQLVSLLLAASSCHTARCSVDGKLCVVPAAASYWLACLVLMDDEYYDGPI